MCFTRLFCAKIWDSREVSNASIEKMTPYTICRFKVRFVKRESVICSFAEFGWGLKSLRAVYPDLSGRKSETFQNPFAHLPICSFAWLLICSFIPSNPPPPSRWRTGRYPNWVEFWHHRWGPELTHHHRATWGEWNNLGAGHQWRNRPSPQWPPQW